MSVRDAAIQVLQAAKEPLRSAEITERILRQKLWTPTGKTPSATVEARICTEIKQNGDASIFVRVAPRTFGLRELGAKPASVTPSVIPKPVTEPKPKIHPKTYSFTDAAEKVLEQFGNKQPMHFRDITQKALDMHWIGTEGRTPEATMAAQLYTTIKRAQRRGEQAKFVQHGRGMFGLGKWMGQGLAYQITQHNKQVRQALRKRLFEMTWQEFEDLVAQLLGAMEFDVQNSVRQNDKGIDVRGVLAIAGAIKVRMAVQVKKWRHNVQAPIVQQVRGSLSPHEQGLIITTGDFSAGARKEAARPDAAPISLMNGDDLARLLIENGIGVVRRSHEIFELGETASATAGQEE